jgi:putative membrane protein
MKKNLSLFLKGIILGISFILPGISGGVLAISMGIYEKLINSISNIFKDFKENLKFLFPIGLGVCVSVILFVLFLDFIFEKFPVPSTLLFLGLILGGLPSLFNNLKNKFNLKNVLYFLIGFSLIFLLDSLVQNDSNLLASELTFANILKLATIGIVIAGSIIVPGVSGSILLMSMGYYKTFLEITSQLIKLQNLSTNILLILPIGIGGIVGIILFIKLIDYCLKKHKDKTNFLIFGIVMSSVIKVIALILDYNITSSNLIIGTILLIVGIIVSIKFFKE